MRQLSADSFGGVLLYTDVLKILFHEFNSVMYLVSERLNDGEIDGCIARFTLGCTAVFSDFETAIERTFGCGTCKVKNKECFECWFINLYMAPVGD